uniref:Adenylyl cyclase-associated protein n=1 Tax=Saimiri boliviensis boliviensis TaxID=39432 RepID=A0A2K6TAH6_SAIBB
MADMQNLVERLERAVGHLEAVSHTSDMHCGYGDSPSKAGAAPCMQAFDLLLAGPVTEYLKISKEVGGDVQKHAEKVHTGLKLERALLVTVSQCQQPADNKLSDLLASISDNLLNHLSPVSESIQARGWVAMAPKAGLYVKKINDAYKDVDKKHAHIKEFHTTGPVAKELSGLPFGPSAGPDPPSPPPGSPPPPVSPSSGSDESASCSALFAQINQGESITHALKHVSDDMKTLKNPALKAQSGPVHSGPKPFSAPKPQTSPSPKPATKKEPGVLELEGKKWRVENQENVSNLVIDDTELKQVAYIYKCVNTTLQIKGKINSTAVDNSKKLGLVFDDVVGIVEIINSRDVKVQVMGKVPTISINKTDGCRAYLSKNSLDCETVTAKSSEKNVLIPTEGSGFNEFPVPKQFKTLWNGQMLVTTVTEIAG